MKHTPFATGTFACTLSAALTLAPNTWCKGDDSASEDEAQSIEDVVSEPTESSAEPAAADTATSSADANSPVEEEGKSYYFAGLRYRGIIMPQFILASFLDGAEGQYFGGLGPEFTIRKNGTDITLSAVYTDYSMDETRVKGAGDPEYAWSSVSSTLKMMYFMIELTGSTELHPKWSWYYGGGAGFAMVFGDVIRNELVPNPVPPMGQPLPPVAQWAVCTPGADPLYCSGDTPPNYSEPSWFNGGSKPPLFPWLGIQTGVRFKPHRRFVTRAELGLTLTGLFFTIAADYGL